MSLNWYKKISILFIVIISSYLIFRFIQHKINILGITENAKEGFPVSDTSSLKFDSANEPVMKSTNPDKYPDLKLKDYIVKSSYNTAYTGSIMHLNAIKYAIKRGYRFLDFEIFMINNTPCVGYSEDDKGITLKSLNVLPLDRVLNVANNYAFSSDGCGNFEDPLFINFRIKTDDSNIYQKIYDSIGKIIISKGLDPATTAFTNKAGDYNSAAIAHIIRANEPFKYMKLKHFIEGHRVFNDAINGTTKLKDIMGKIIFVVDLNDSKSYYSCRKKSYSTGDPNSLDYDCNILASYVNIEGGSDNLITIKYDDLLNQPINPPNVNIINISTDNTVLKLSHPNVIDFDSTEEEAKKDAKKDNSTYNNSSTFKPNISNPDISKFYKDYGVNFLLMRLYLNDKGLKDYENLFKKSGNEAFIPFSRVIENIDVNK